MDIGQLDMDKQLLRAASKSGRRRPGVHQAAEGRQYIGIRGLAALHASEGRQHIGSRGLAAHHASEGRQYIR